jgi:hypothetical protein
VPVLVSGPVLVPAQVLVLVQVHLLELQLVLALPALPRELHRSPRRRASMTVSPRSDCRSSFGSSQRDFEPLSR